MNAPKTFRFMPQKNTIQVWVLASFIITVGFIFLFYLSQSFEANGLLHFIRFILFIAVATLIVFQYRMLSSLFKNKWLKISHKNVTDSYSLLKLGKIPLEDVEKVSLVQWANFDFLKLNLNRESDCFKDVNEPKGLLLDIYNFFFNGDIYLPLHFFNYDKFELGNFLNELKEYLNSFKPKLQNLDIQKSIEPHFVTPYAKVESEGPPPFLRKDTLSEESFYLDDIFDSPKTITRIDKQTVKFSDTDLLVKKICEVYVDMIRTLPHWSHNVDPFLGITKARAFQDQKDVESVEFELHGVNWTFKITRLPQSDQAVFTIDVGSESQLKALVELGIGSLDLVSVELCKEGTWLGEYFTLFEKLKENRALST